MKHRKTHIRLIISLLTILSGFAPNAFSQAVQTEFYYDSFPTAACPEVRIGEKYDHMSSPRYRRMGWDTVVTCDVQQLILESEPYIPVQYFNGTYEVTQIPFNPPDTTFARGSRMPISSDDVFGPLTTFPSRQITSSGDTIPPFIFYFFGIGKSSFVLGANGLVTFAASAANQSCPYSYSAGIPWGNNTSGAPLSLNLMRDAIYGIYEDTDPQASITASHSDPNWGIYYGIQDSYPCRKIICSWNDMVEYRCNSNRCTYQIACYEGSNIVEVHVQKRNYCSNWINGVGTIGIQNATGQDQQPANPQMMTLPNGTQVPNSNAFVVAGSPAAFAPAGYNTFASNLYNTAFRFTPQGSTQKDYEWYRIFDDDREPIPITSDDPNMLYDTNTYAYVQRRMNPLDRNHPTLTRIVVAPRASVTKYMIKLRFQNANRDWYDLRDTIVIGRDTLNTTKLAIAGTESSSLVRDTMANPENYNVYHRICYGPTSTVRLRYPSPQEHKEIHWEVVRIFNGQETTVPESEYSHPNDTTFIVPPIDTTLYGAKKIDTLKFTATVDYKSGCSNFASIFLLTYPNFDTTLTDRVCKHTDYVWNIDHGNIRRTYPTSEVNTNNPTATALIRDSIMLHSEPGCDSMVRMNLTIYDVSHTTDRRVECHAITWQNGRRYTESNTATAERDTIVRKNMAGCDSVVQLDLTITPLVPKLEADIDEFDYDHLTVNLTDISIGNETRTWVLPNGNTYSSPVTSYTIPADADEADIKMIAYSPYGCTDSTHIRLPFNKETFWVPNIFTPDDPQGNALFGVIGTKIYTQKIQIFNRRGEMVYECECEGTNCNWDGSSTTASAGCTWDGRDLNGEKCPQAAYVYIIRYSNTYHPERTITKTGTITLLR